MIFEQLGEVERESGGLLAQAISPNRTFNPTDWENIFKTEIEGLTVLPDSLNEILESPCPFVKGKRRADTHFLSYFPPTIEQSAFTLMSFSRLVRKKHDLELFCEDDRDRLGETISYIADVPWHHWYLTFVDNFSLFAGKSYEEQLGSMPEDYFAHKMVEILPILYFIHLKSGKDFSRTLQDAFLRTVNKDGDGDCFCVCSRFCEVAGFLIDVAPNYSKRKDVSIIYSMALD